MLVVYYLQSFNFVINCIIYLNELALVLRVKAEICNRFCLIRKRSREEANLTLQVNQMQSYTFFIFVSSQGSMSVQYIIQ